MKKALLIISFGSSVKIARKAIYNIEKHLEEKYEDYDFFRAFTSRMIIKKLEERDGIKVDLPVQALKRIKDMGYTDVVCQSLHVINGVEYDMTKKEISSFKNCFNSITFGKPLLTHEEDYKIVAESLKKEYSDKEAVLFMGHGTEHYANASYCMLEDMLEFVGFEKAFVGTVEGFPTLEYAVDKLKKQGIKNITLAPFMIVAGDHALNDMAGDDEDSWKNILENQGFHVDVVLKGLGNYEFIAELFYEHSKSNNEI